MKTIRKLSFVIILTLSLGLVVLLTLLLLSAEKESPMPSPNGYESLLTAIALRTPLPLDRKLPADMNEAELKEFVTANQEALEAAREAFQQDSRVNSRIF